MTGQLRIETRWRNGSRGPEVTLRYLKLSVCYPCFAPAICLTGNGPVSVIRLNRSERQFPALSGL